MKNFTQIAALSLKEIQKEIEKYSAELVAIRMGIQAASEGDHSKYSKTRTHIARLKTARRQKELGISSPKKS